MTAKPNRKSNRTFKTYIKKCFKKVISPKGKEELSSDTCNTFDSIMITLSTAICRQLRDITKTKTITTKAVEAVVRMNFSEELADNSLEYAQNAVDLFESWTREEKGEGEKTEKVMKENKAGLMISVSLVENYFLRSQSNLNVSVNVPVYLTGVLEFVCTEILKLTVWRTMYENLIRIRIQDLKTAVEESESFSALFRRYNILILGGGITPSRRISAPLRGRTKKNTTLRKIKNIQSRSGYTQTYLCKAHMNRACNEVLDFYAKDFTSSVKIKAEVRDVIHRFVEDRVVNMFYEVNMLCSHADRETLKSRDFELWFELNHIDTEYSLLNVEFNKPTIQKLAYLAGITRMTQHFSSHAVIYIVYLLHSVLRNCAEIMYVRGNSGLLNLFVLREALSNFGFEINVVPKKMKKRNAGDAVTTVTDAVANVGDVENDAEGVESDAEGEESVEGESGAEGDEGEEPGVEDVEDEVEIEVSDTEEVVVSRRRKSNRKSRSKATS